MFVRRFLPVLGFALLALAVSWPLPLHLTTRLTGTPTGDTGVYVWNLWIFRHELLRHAQWPLFTDHIFVLTNGTDLSVHNYTIFADLLALPFVATLGVVTTFNVIYLLLIASSGYAAFLLVKHLTGRSVESFIAGAAFAASPFLVARGTAHFSLVAAAPLPIFLLCLLRTLRSGGWKDALAAGAVIGWAGYCDVYYTIYCLLMGALFLAHDQWRIDRPASVATSASGRRSRSGRRALTTVIDVLLAIGAFVIAWRLWHGPSAATILGRPVSLQTLYTPVLIMTALALLRWQVISRWRVHRRTDQPSLASRARLVAVAMTSAAVVLSPVIVGLGRRVIDGRFPSPPIGWRSSPPGVDLFDLLVPNPNHPWFGAPGLKWIATGGPLAFPEFVGSLSLVALAIVGFAVWRMRRAVPRIWLVFTLAFVLLSLGPFVQVGRVNTYFPAPWMLLRYVPIVGLARSPARFAVVAALGLSVMLGFALAALRAQWPARSRLVTAALGGLLALELLPAPRPLYDAGVPALYSLIRQDANEFGRLLELPTGVRDGTSSLGDFNASAQYFQTMHRKPLIGGYQSRVSEQRKQSELRIPMLDALFRLSERRDVPPDLAARARASSDAFLDEACLGYVVIDRQRASPELRRFAIETLHLKSITTDGDRELFVPGRRMSSACASNLP